MDSMEHEDPLLTTLQGNVNRKMGRCILRLQQYERLMKRMLAAHDLTYVCDLSNGLVTDPLATRTAALQNKTLGHLVGELSDSYLSVTEADDETADTNLAPSQASFRVRMGTELSDERYQKAKHDLTTLVALRNHLVHHFMEQFDLFSESGCRAAELCLDEAYQRIDQHDRELRSWAEGMDHCREHMLAFLQSTEYRDVLLYGLVPGQPVDWPCTTIVQQLSRAESACHEAGWTSLTTAIGFIHLDWPELNPKKYGCRSWRHVIHQSGLFEIQKRKPADSERTQVWYRSKPALS